MRLTEMKMSTIHINAEVRCRGFELCCLISLFWLGCLEVPQLVGGSTHTDRAAYDVGSSNADQSIGLLDPSVAQDEAHTSRIIYRQNSAFTRDVFFTTVGDVRQTDPFELPESNQLIFGSKTTHHE